MSSAHASFRGGPNTDNTAVQQHPLLESPMAETWLKGAKASRCKPEVPDAI